MTAVDANGTIEMVHLGGSGIKKLYIDLRSPDVHQNKDGVLLNSFLRVRTKNDDGPRLSGQLWKAFGSLWAVPSSELENWETEYNLFVLLFALWYHYGYCERHVSSEAGRFYLAKHGLGVLVTGIDVPGINTNRSFESTPQRTVMAIQELGPTYIKLGQILSTRPDVIPPAYIEALQTLQDDVVSLPFSEIVTVLDEELGQGWSELIE